MRGERHHTGAAQWNAGAEMSASESSQYLCNEIEPSSSLWHWNSYEYVGVD